MTTNTILSFAILTTSVFAQDAAAPGGGWRRLDAAAPADSEAAGAVARDEFGQTRTANSPARASDLPVPQQLIIPAGAWIKIRVDRPLSSDRNAAGDTFSATLTQPIVADGFVVARRGQSVEGRVSEAIRAGKAKGTSRLGIELTALSLVDGRQMPVRTQLMEYSGGTSVGRDLAAAGTATGTGAAIGAVAGGGVGAAIGAAVGAAASGIGVLTTRGRATEIYPEAEVTFRTMEPITVNTERGAQAFVTVTQGDYEPRLQQRSRQTTVVRQQAPFFNPYFGGGYWGGGYWGGGPFWGPGFNFYSGPRFGGRGGFRGGGFRGGRR